MLDYDSTEMDSDPRFDCYFFRIFSIQKRSFAEKLGDVSNVWETTISYNP